MSAAKCSLPGSLTRTVKARGDRLKLFRSTGQEHDYGHAVGRAASLDPRHPDGPDEQLADCADRGRR